jgi:hypothetical protein
LEKERIEAIITCMDFNKTLMTLLNQHGIQDGITWTTSDFPKKKGFNLELHGLQSSPPPPHQRTEDGLYLDYIKVLMIVMNMM